MVHQSSEKMLLCDSLNCFTHRFLPFMTKTIPSPCRSTCKLNEEDICVGCYRHMQEIALWNKMDDKARQNALNLCELRRNDKPYDQQDLNKTRPITSVEYRRFQNR